jgi:ribosomal protein L7/L12
MQDKEIKVTRNCCLYHDIGLNTEDIVWGMARRGRKISAVNFLKDHGLSLKEAKDKVEKIVAERTLAV